MALKKETRAGAPRPPCGAVESTTWVHVTQRSLDSQTLVEMQPTVTQEKWSAPSTLSNTVIPHFGSTEDSKDFEESTSASHRQQMSGTVEHSSTMVIIR